MIQPPKPGTLAGIREQLANLIRYIDGFQQPSPADERRAAGVVFERLAALLHRCWEVER